LLQNALPGGVRPPYKTKKGDGLNLNVQEALREQFADLRSRNPAFSLRAYARRLGLNSGVLSAVMRGDRQVSSAWAQKIVPRMKLPAGQEKAIYQGLRAHELLKGGRRAAELPQVLRLKSDEFRLIAESLHFALLALFDLDNFKSDSKWMAQQLGVSPQSIRQALGRLQRLGLVAQDKRTKRWKTTGARLRTSDGVSDLAIRHFHVESLELAKKAIYEQDTSERDLLCTTVAINRDKLPLARQMIREFVTRLEAALTEAPRENVYRMAIQLFPLSRGSGGRND